MSSVGVAIVLVALTAVGACADPAPAPRITPTDEPPPASRPSTSAAPPSTIVLGPGPKDLRQMDWAQATLPGEFCAIDGVVRFQDGEATAESAKWGQVHLSVHVDLDKTPYGDIDGDTQEEVAVSVGCDNGSQTAAGQLGFGYVIVRSHAGELVTVGTITPRQEVSANSHVTLLDGAEVTKNQVVVNELWYRDIDSTCCPSGRSRTTWHLRNNQLTPGETVLIS